ncbi:hypothetical protein E6P97_02985 [Patescibacteria group bacterium]|nr:MAG: hypothetical protein E6P97_02985 [Patescibacteria group bacterium]
MLAFKIVLLLVAALANLFFGLAVWQRDLRKTNNISFFALTLSIAGWVAGIAAFLLTKSPETALIWAKIYYFFPLLIAVSLIMFVLTFPNGGRIPRLLLWLLLSGFVSLAIPLVSVNSFVTGEVIYRDWGKEVVLEGFSYSLYALYLLAWYPGALLIMYKKSKTEHGLHKKQARSFFRGFLTTAIFAVTLNLIFPWVGNYRYIWLGPLFTSVFLWSIGYSIVKHRMFDLRLFFARSLAYVFSHGFLIFGYSVVSQMIATHLTPDGQGAEFDPVNVLMIVFAVLSYGYVKRFFDRATNSLFYRDAYDPQFFLDDLNKLLVSTTDIGELLESATTIISENMKPEFAVFGLKESDTSIRRIYGINRESFKEQDIERVRRMTPSVHEKVIATDSLGEEHRDLRAILDRNRIAIIIRLVDDANDTKEGVGYFVLGVKKSGNPYGKQDIQILDIIANELVIATQNALRFEEIQQFNVTLQEKIDRATKQLKHANDKLVALNETKDDFISMASHQLRTPLTAVKGNISMIMDGDFGKVPKTAQDPLGQAYASSERMVGLIADLLNVSRLRTGKFAIQPVASNLDAVVKSELKQLQETAKTRKLTLKYHAPKQFPTLQLDEIKVRQVIMNFIDNAIYYTPAGGHIDVALTHNTKAIEFTVTDSGIGVPRHLQKNLFTKFYRADNAQKMRPDGTGIGLFMAKKVIVASGGSVIFKSREGRGSTFGFTIPLAKIAPAPVAQQS